MELGVRSAGQSVNYDVLTSLSGGEWLGYPRSVSMVFMWKPSATHTVRSKKNLANAAVNNSGAKTRRLVLASGVQIGFRYCFLYNV
jgi:hypothetical protein